MNNLALITRMKAILPEPTLPWILAALRQDPVIWECLEETTYLERVLEQCTAKPETWSPANLSLLAMDVQKDHPDLTLENLQGDLQFSLESGLRQKAAHTFETVNRNSIEVDPESSTSQLSCYPLQQAGLMALALRERRRFVGSWQGLIGELDQASLETHNTTGKTLLERWGTTLSCLYGMLPDPVELLRSLLNSAASPDQVKLVLHIVLSNPHSPEKQLEILKNQLTRLPLRESIIVLDCLKSHRPEFTQILAENLVDDQKDIAKGCIDLPALSDPVDPFKYVAWLDQLLQHVDSYYLAGQGVLAAPLVNTAWEVTRRLQADLVSQAGQILKQQGDQEKSLNNMKQAAELVPANPFHKANVALALLDTNQPEEALNYISLDGTSDEQIHPVLQYALVKIYSQNGNPQGAREQALKLIKSIETGCWPMFEANLPKLLLGLDLYEEAARAADHALIHHPNDIELLVDHSQALMDMEDYTGASNSLRLAVTLAPERLDLSRKLAVCYEENEDWDHALDVHTDILKAQSTVLSSDLHNMAKSALKAKQAAKAAEACQQALSQDNEDGMAHALLGEALIELGDPHSAQEHLNQATLSSPDLVRPWLSLADLQVKSGNGQIALETLRSATQAVPDACGVYLALGEAYLADWEGRGHPAPAQALTMFQQAASLAARSKGTGEAGDRKTALKIALRLGETLHQLGHLVEAHQTLETAYVEKPSFPGLAYAYAQNLLALEQPGQALQPLAFVLDSHPPEPEPYLDYARAILATGEEPQKAINTLQEAMKIDPELVEAQGLLAEALAANDDLTGALKSYQTALETNLVDDPVWCSRLSLGLGSVALDLGLPDIAIAALQEAGQADPANIAIQRLLTEAYQASNLLDDALQNARAALRLAPDDVDHLTWFGEKVMQLLEKNKQLPDGTIKLPENFSSTINLEAMNAIGRAIQLAPKRPDLLVRLGNIQCQAGDHTGALSTFCMVVSQRNANPEDLHLAGQKLLVLGDIPNSVSALERALHQQGKEAYIVSNSNNLPCDLVAAYRAAGNPQAALAIIEQALFSAPETISLLELKADLLFELDRFAEALTCLEQALTFESDIANKLRLHHQASLILRTIGKIPEALTHADQILAVSDPLPQDPLLLSGRVLAASLAVAILEPERARAILGVPPADIPPETNQTYPGKTNKIISSYANLYDYYCLRAELALSFDDSLDANHSFDKAQRNVPADNSKVRLLAIHSRIAYRCGDQQTAIQLLQDALSSKEQAPAIKDLTLRVHTYLSLAEASLELSHWESALFLFRQAIETLPHESFPHLSLARALTLRAEAQRFYQAVNSIKHAPGLASLSEHAYESYSKAIDAAAGNCPPSTASAQVITRWRVRGQAAFQPDLQSAQALAAQSAFPLSPDDVAAQLIMQRYIYENNPKSEHSGDETPNIVSLSPSALAIQTAQPYPLHPLVMSALALMLTSTNDHMEDALASAQTAVQASQTKQLITIAEDKTDIAGQDSLEANVPVQVSTNIYLSANYLETVISQALLAIVAEKAGDLNTAMEAIQAALSIWSDEPRWHALAAQILQQKGDLPETTHHLEQAVALDPDHIPHYLMLGNTYMDCAALSPASNDNPFTSQAIQILEKARHLAPDDPDPWLALAHAYQQANDFGQAASCAEQAIALSPDRTAPLLLRAEIALQAGQPQEAHDQLQTLLIIENQKNPEKTSQVSIAPVVLLARTLNELDRPKDALDLIEKTIPQTEEPLPLLMERVKILKRTQGSEAEMQALHELSNLFPNEPIVLTALSKALSEAGQEENAILAAQHALQQVSTSSKENNKRLLLSMPEQASLHLLLGRMLRHAGQLDQALYHLDEAIHKDPRLIESYIELGRAHQERRQHSLALQIYKQATAVAPKDPRPYYQAGIALKESKDYLGAETMLRRAAALAPNDLSIHRQLGAVVALNLVHSRRQISTTLEDV